jgi:hypothetical protein
VTSSTSKTNARRIGRYLQKIPRTKAVVFAGDFGIDKAAIDAHFGGPLM